MRRDPTGGYRRSVIDTHLHFDHAGGNTFKDRDGSVRLTFPRRGMSCRRASTTMRRTQTSERQAATSRTTSCQCTRPGVFDLVEGERELVSGIRLLPTPGHTPHHQSVLLESAGVRACILADLVPTTTHLPLPWIMGYDVEPLVTLETKRRVLKRAQAEDWLLLFVHDPRSRGESFATGNWWETEERVWGLGVPPPTRRQSRNGDRPLWFFQLPNAKVQTPDPPFSLHHRGQIP